eukprot:GHVP01053247.1.p1 GENE.GHVP01053247.1~~GHVP01053247.1.p1  ORF type:complete len:353 (+),score=28.22 GHVP01053247.1:377-1435(+)
MQLPTISLDHEKIKKEQIDTGMNIEMTDNRPENNMEMDEDVTATGKTQVDQARYKFYFPLPPLHMIMTFPIVRSKLAEIGNCVLMTPLFPTAEAYCLVRYLDLVLERMMTDWNVASKVNQKTFSVLTEHTLVSGFSDENQNRLYLIARNPYLISALLTIKSGSKCHLSANKNLIFLQARLRKPIFNGISKVVGQHLLYGNLVDGRLADLQYFIEVDTLLEIRKKLNLSNEDRREIIRCLTTTIKSVGLLSLRNYIDQSSFHKNSLSSIISASGFARKSPFCNLSPILEKVSFLPSISNMSWEELAKIDTVYDIRHLLRSYQAPPTSTLQLPTRVRRPMPYNSIEDFNKQMET